MRFYVENDEVDDCRAEGKIQNKSDADAGVAVQEEKREKKSIPSKSLGTYLFMTKILFIWDLFEIGDTLHCVRKLRRRMVLRENAQWDRQFLSDFILKEEAQNQLKMLRMYERTKKCSAEKINARLIWRSTGFAKYQS